MSAAQSPTVSPEQAFRLSGVSRWSIMRAIKAGRLKAFRDNRGHWRIDRRDLEDWRAALGAQGVRTGAAHRVGDAETVASLAAQVGLLQVQLRAAERARDAAEADRDAWRAVAADLARKRRWWLW